jgi:hypothetical protein
MNETTRYFLTYRSVALPLALAEEVDPASIGHRGTYFQARYDRRGLMVRCEKRVYGDLEFVHEYEYDLAGKLTRATVTAAGDDPRVLSFPSSA